MNKPLAVSINVFATALVSNISAAGDVFDSPGPGYWQQIERAFPRPVKDVPTTPIHIAPWSWSFSLSHLQNQPFPAAKLLDSTHSAPSLSPSIVNAFSEPIRFLSR